MRLKISIVAALLVFFASSGISQTKSNDPVLMTVDGTPITKSQFLRVYLKNNDNPKYDKATLDKYMKLYTAFRLKVAEAEAEGYDTIPALENELKGYKDQLAQPYLVDTTSRNKLMHEAYNRMKYEVKASHILVKLAPNATPEDTLKAYNKIMAIRKRIIDGEDFGAIAAKASDDPSAKENKGNLGYFSAFQMVYPFETAAYNTPVGKVSMPIRSRFGYHIIKVTDKRPARGTITVAHIMIALSKSPTKEDIANAKKKIDEIYQKLQNGADFSEMAKLYSDDRGSKNNGGKLPPFGTGTNRRMVPIFEEAAFALKKDGDFSNPIRSSYGFHIIKRVSLKPLGTFDELKNEIKRKIERDKRGTLSKTAFIAGLKRKHNFSEESEKVLPWFYKKIDTTFFTKDWKAPSIKKGKTMFTYRGNGYDSKQFLAYLKTQRFAKKMPIKEFIDKQYKDWQNSELVKDEKSRLETEYPAYKALMTEYHDGVLLYEIMKNKVWDKAIKDTTGLKNYFQSNIAKYQWPERIDATIYSSANKDKVLEAMKLSKIDTMTMKDILKEINKDSQLNIDAKEGKYIASDQAELKGRTFKIGANPIYNFNDKYYFVKVAANIPAGPKKLEETRGLVIQDYQSYLEKNWLAQLRKKHTVKVNKDVLYSLGK